MATRLTQSEREKYLASIGAVLDQQARRQQTLTYLELADAVAMPGPQRIHRVTRLLEILMQRDATAGRPIRSALAVSRVGQGLPAAGFFDRAARLGLFDGKDPAGFHRRQLEALFAGAGSARVSPVEL
ncbi:hypothetical protein [Wenzhouxiangella limi]|uniref:hypothetical protein n=1 Tax=Wenzhouxiangella limi TaxID=2707351 RepID=UPI001940ED7F|nr:hypothetical protein [Wenzhouxiangella limi]